MIERFGWKASLSKTLSVVCGALLLGGGLRASATQPQDRFKADLLLVVAHPDDETAVGAYLARAIFDEHKRVAVVFGTRGGSGGDEAGPQQAAALEDVRETEARKALAHFGVMDVWFLRGLDTPGQDVLRSLENWNHGDQLDRLVRIVRLTRPTVIMTWLPWVSMGEDHGDHQAASVLATEAFDMAGNPAMFPEQIATPRDPDGMNNLLEGLQPWQAQKLYFFSDTIHPQTMEGKGPTYSATEVSPSRGVPYERLAAEEGSEHLSQGDSGGLAKRALETGKYGYFADPVRLILGKSLVPCNTTDDVFAGVQSKELTYHSAPGFRPHGDSTVSMELGGPWLFYKRFWPAHGLQGESGLPVPELLLNVANPVTVPIHLTNPTDKDVTVAINVRLPEAWIYWRRPPQRITIPAHSSNAFTFTVRTPEKATTGENAIIVEGEGLSPVRLNVRIDESAMPQ